MPETQPTLFRAEVDRRAWKDHVVFLRHFRKSAAEVATLDGLPQLATLEPAAATFEAWYYTARKPQKDFQRVLTHMFGHSIDRLWGPAAQATPGAAPGTPDIDVPAYVGTDLRETLPSPCPTGTGSWPEALTGEFPASGSLPPGGRFHPRCPVAVHRCRSDDPVPREVPGDFGDASPAQCGLLGRPGGRTFRYAHLTSATRHRRRPSRHDALDVHP